MNKYCINFGILPIKLTDQHILAEMRLISEIIHSVKKLIILNKDLDIPVSYNIGDNNFKFFYNKLEYLHSRFTLLKDEASTRHLKNIQETPIFEMDDVVLDNKFLSYYNPVKKINISDIEISKSMIVEQLQITSERLKYCGNKISKKEAIALLN